MLKQSDKSSTFKLKIKEMGKEITKNIFEDHILFSAFLFVACVTFVVSNKIYEVQPTPYIDEIFHVPQAQLYCRNVWNEWDPKITTLPGLYLISYAILKPFEIFKNNICSLYTLRMVNLIGTLVNFVLSYKIMSKLHNVSATGCLKNICMNVVSAVNITIFPTLYFFTFLYYTDVWSVSFVLLTYYCHISTAKSSKYFTAVSGMMAVMMRQTNIIWIGFMIMDDIWNIFVKNLKSKKLQDYKFTLEAFKTLKKYLPFTKMKNKKRKSSSILHLIKEIFSFIYPSLVVCLLFVLFVILNGSIVLGDKQAHTVVLHPMQNLYFLDFAAFFGLPFFLVQVLSRRKLPNMYLVLLFSCFSVVLSEINKLEHPYLLADNRHFAFYIWKRIFGHDIVRRIIIVTYAISGSILIDLMGHCHFMQKVCLAFCIIFQLSLQHLFELRYFIIPYIMIRLHFRQNKSVWLEFIYFSLINAVTIYIFINKPFSWVSEPNVIQRFIW